MVLTIFMTLFGCIAGFVAAYVCTHCCCNSRSSNSSKTAFKERIKYLTNMAVKEWLRIDIENMQRQYVAIENAKSGFFESFNDFNFMEPEPEMVDLIDYEDDEDRLNLLAYEGSNDNRTIEVILDKWVDSVKRIIES